MGGRKTATKKTAVKKAATSRSKATSERKARVTSQASDKRSTSQRAYDSQFAKALGKLGKMNRGSIKTIAEAMKKGFKPSPATFSEELAWRNPSGDSGRFSKAATNAAKFLKETRISNAPKKKSAPKKKK